MVETWRWPKASYSVEEIERVDTPSRAAASRSMVRLTCSPRCCWSESMSVMTDESWRNASPSLGAQV